MGDTTYQIEAHIEDTREHLGSNLDELEQRVKTAIDWKQYFQSNPMIVFGIAFGGGVLLAAMLGRRKKTFTDTLSPQSGPSGRRSGNGTPTHQALEMLDEIKGALIGVAATRLKDFIGEVVPGFDDELHRTTAKQTILASGH